MPSWTESHYQRAEEFVRALATAVPPLAPGARVAETPAPHPTPSAAAPVAPAPGSAPAPVPAPPAPAAAPTAASVFKKMPWKK